VWVLLFVAIAIVSMTYGNIVAIAQKNIKRLLAYSGIAQIGNVMIGLAAGTKRGSDAILFYLLTYLFANLGAFAVVIGVGNRIKSDEIEDYNGLNRRSPFLAAAMLLFLLSLAGVPPLAGFIGKLYIFVAAIEQELYLLLIVGLVNIVISMYYYLVVVKKMYINEPADPTPLSVSAPLQTAIFVGIAGTLLLGLYPAPFIDWAVAATLMFWLAALTEAVGAVLLLFGLATRWISIPLMITMLVAAFAVHWEDGWYVIAPSGSEEIGVRLDRAKDILQEHGNYEWLTEHGNFAILGNGIEFAATYFIMLLVLFFAGGGRCLSADYWIARKFREQS